jgi:RES domain-containing protein
MAASATPLSGVFFRAVEFRWMHPDDVMSGAGAAKLGGRFVAIGTKALYVSDSEKTLLQEISERKRRLGGKALIDLERYPRVTFRIDLKLDRHISFVKAARSKDLERLRRQCLDIDDLSASQAVGSYVASSGVQAILYPSVAGAGTNVVVFVDNTRGSEVVLFNRPQVIDQLARYRRP